MNAETTTIPAVVVRNSLPAEIVAIAPEALAEVAALAHAAGQIEVRDVETLNQANDLYKSIDRLAKSIASGRLEITRPIDALKKQIISAEEMATTPLLEAKRTLGEKILVCQRELERIRQEAERKAREEAEKRAAEERARQEAERQALIKKQQEEHAAAEAKAKAEAELFGTEPEAIEPPPPPPPPVVVVPVTEVTALPPTPKAAVRVTTRQKLVIFDESLIPLAMAGVVLRVPDEKAIEKLLKDGVKVPGARLESVEYMGAAGGRK